MTLAFSKKHLIYVALMQKSNLLSLHAVTLNIFFIVSLAKPFDGDAEMPCNTTFLYHPSIVISFTNDYSSVSLMKSINILSIRPLISTMTIISQLV